MTFRAGIVGAATIAFAAGVAPAGAQPSGAQQSAAGSQAKNEACNLLPKAAAAAALGEAAKEGKALANMPAGPGSTVSSCEYTASGINRVRLNVTHMAADALAMYRGICEKGDKKGLTGLGDVACWYNDKHGELHAIKGTLFLSIELRRNGDPTEPIKAAMKDALGRLH